MGHLSAMRDALHPNRRIRDLIQLSGCDFEASILELTASGERRSAELKWIDLLRPTLNIRDCKFRAHPSPIRKPRKFKSANRNIASQVDPAIFNAIEAMATADDRTMSYVIEKLLAEAIARQKQAATKTKK
jgi:hypothetical protein